MLSTRESFFSWVKFRELSSVIFAHGSEENDDGINSLNLVTAFSDRHLPYVNFLLEAVKSSNVTQRLSKNGQIRQGYMREYC